MEITRAGVEVCPSSPLARLQFRYNHKLLFRPFESLFKLAFMNRVFAVEFVASCLCEKNVMSEAKVECTLRPTVSFVIKTIMLIGAGRVSVDLRDHGRCERTYLVPVCGWFNQLTRTQQQPARFLVTTGKMMKSCFD